MEAKANDKRIMARLTPEFHGKLKQFAKENGVQIQDLVVKGLEEIMRPEKYRVTAIRQVIVEEVAQRTAA